MRERGRGGSEGVREEVSEGEAGGQSCLSI